MVDDDTSVLRAITSALAAGNYKVMVAEDGVAGLTVFLERATEIALVISDIAMPRMSGVEMAQRITAEHPGAKVLLMTGYSEALIGADGGRTFPLLRKPFLPDQLLAAVRSALGSS